MKFSNIVLAGFLGLISLLPLSVSAQAIHLTTEEYPPFNMSTVSGRITGYSMDVVKEMFKRANVEYDVELLPWQRAYKLALETPGYGVFSTTRTEAREPLFKWVTPVAYNNWIFLAKKNRNIRISSLDDARNYRIGGYRGDAVANYLEGEGFKLDLVSRDELNALKIDRDRIDLWASGHLLGPFYAKKHGVKGLEPVFTFKETIMGIAFNKDVPDQIVNGLNQALVAMSKDGALEKIAKKYR